MLTPILIYSEASASLRPKIHSLFHYSGVVTPSGDVHHFAVRDDFGKQLMLHDAHRVVWASFRADLREKAQIEFRRKDPGHLYPWQTSEEEVAAIEF